jgi:hypothetical protein
MKEARDRAAFGARNPKVTRSSVKNNLECLRRGTKCYFRVILRIHEVVERNVVTTSKGVLLLRPVQVVTV